MTTIIDRLIWDSEFFGYPVGKIVVEEKGHDQLINIKDAAKAFRLVYVYSDNKINFDGFKHVDTKLIFEKKVERLPFKLSEDSFKYKIETFEIERHNSIQLRRLALQSGEFSRFFIDEDFKNGEYKKLYNQWVTKSINKNLAFEILVAIQANKIIGFITLSEADENTAEIGLLAIDNYARGKGIATKLIKVASNIVFQKGYEQFSVATQKSNKPAVHLYKKLGFKEKTSQHIYHIWNHDTI